MLTTAPVREIPISQVIRRRGVGKVMWRNMIDDILGSEREDMLDLATLRRKISDPELLKLISQLYERKAIRMMELIELSRYSDKGDRGKE